MKQSKGDWDTGIRMREGRVAICRGECRAGLLTKGTGEYRSEAGRKGVLVHCQSPGESLLVCAGRVPVQKAYSYQHSQICTQETSNQPRTKYNNKNNQGFKKNEIEWISEDFWKHWERDESLNGPWNVSKDFLPPEIARIKVIKQLQRWQIISHQMFKNKNVRWFSSLFHSKIIQLCLAIGLPISSRKWNLFCSSFCSSTEGLPSHSSSKTVLALLTYPMHTFRLSYLLFVFDLVKHDHIAIFFSFSWSLPSLLPPFCSFFLHRLHKYYAVFSVTSFLQYSLSSMSSSILFF